MYIKIILTHSLSKYKNHVAGMQCAHTILVMKFAYVRVCRPSLMRKKQSILFFFLYNNVRGTISYNALLKLSQWNRIQWEQHRLTTEVCFNCFHFTVHWWLIFHVHVPASLTWTGGRRLTPSTATQENCAPCLQTHWAEWFRVSVPIHLWGWHQ